MAYCSNCGTQIAENQNFCANCGAGKQGAAGAPGKEPPYQAPPQGTPMQRDIQDNKVFAVISYIWFLPLVSYFAAKDSPYARFHAVQGLNLFIVEVIVGTGGAILRGIFRWVPLFSGILSAVTGLLGLGFLALSIIGIIYAAQGEWKELPVISAFKFIKQ